MTSTAAADQAPIEHAHGGKPMIELRSVHKWYGEFHVLKDISLQVGKGERVVVCGPSGSGKSTMIRCINRLEEHQRGQIIVDGIELTSDVKNIEAIRREVGMVFPDGAEIAEGAPPQKSFATPKTAPPKLSLGHILAH